MMVQIFAQCIEAEILNFDLVHHCIVIVRLCEI